MGNESQNQKAVKRQRNWRYFILWAAAAVLITVCLIPLYRFLWRDRTQTHTRQECEMVADALLKETARFQRSTTKEVLARRQRICFQGVQAAWSFLYGEGSQEDLDIIYPDEKPDAVAYLTRDGEYQVLFGEFPRDEFDAALKTRQEDSGRLLSNLYEESADEAGGLELAGMLEGTGVLSRIGDVFYYSAEFVQSGAVVISRKAVDPVRIQNDYAEVMSFEDMIMSAADIDTVLVKRSDHTVQVVKGDVELSQGDILEEKPDEEGNLKIGDTWYIAGTSADSDFRIYAMVPASQIPKKSIVSPLFPALLFALLFLLTVLYAWFLRFDILRGRVEKEDSSKQEENMKGILMRHVRLMHVMIAVFICALLILVCMLYVTDTTRVWGKRILMDIEEYFQEDDKDAYFLNEIQTENELAFADTLSSLIAFQPVRMERKALYDLGMAVERDFYLLNEDGTVAASSQDTYDFSALTDEDAEKNPLTSVLEGKADHVGTSITMNGMTSVCWAVRRKDREEGMLLSVDILPEGVTVTDYYADYVVPTGLILFSVDSESGTIVTSSREEYVGLDADSIGLTEEVRADGFCGDITLDGRRYFVQTNAQETRVDLIAADLMYLAGLYLPVELKTIAVGLVMVFLMFALVYIIQRGVWTNLEAAGYPGEAGAEKGAVSGKGAGDKETKAQREERLEKEKESEETASFYRENAGGLRADRPAVGRWLPVGTPFRQMSADEKFRYMISILCAVLLLAGFLLYTRESLSGIMGSTIAYLLQKTWQHGINVYALSYALLLALSIFVFSLVLRRLITFAGRNFGNRGETIARLLSSFIGYAAALSALGLSLMYLGVNTMAILASAGIVGLGISIGAKDLVADILAGIAIVFEGEFRTGDIVEINGFRGNVEEIGIRTTKVMSMGNVKVFRNSEVSGVINLTQRYSIAQVKIHVSRAESLEEVEKIFRKELTRIRRKIPQAVEPVELCGISELNHSYVLLLFQTKCRERDRVNVERMLSHELDLVMERENISSWGQLNHNVPPRVPPAAPIS